MNAQDSPPIIIIGAGPAGLMAAEAALAAGAPVTLCDAMPSPGRKLLLAGRGGLNLTHSEPFDRFLARYGDRAPALQPYLTAFGPEQLRHWATELGIDTFVGSSGRVFPAELKAAPLLRTWLRRLKCAGLRMAVRHRWLGWNDDGTLRFATPDGEVALAASATILALGGASWPQLGSDGGWVAKLAERGIAVAPLAPSNCGFDVGWSEVLRRRFSGAPLKPVTLSFAGARVKGEATITESGLEGGAVYALSAPLRDAIAAHGAATLRLDLKPDWSEERLRLALAKPRGSRSLSSHLARSADLTGVVAALLYEVLNPAVLADAARLAAAVKDLPLTLIAPRPVAEAISSAGGIRFDEVNERLMLRRLPGLFAAGEMLDWEAPTGGYLLTACFATGRAAGQGAAEWVSAARSSSTPGDRPGESR